jgi:hypothetical protein
LINGGTQQQVLYTAPSSIPANATDLVSYTVADQHNDVIINSATGTISLGGATAASPTWNGQTLTAAYDYPNASTLFGSPQQIVANGGTYSADGGLYDFSVSEVNNDVEQITFFNFANSQGFPAEAFNGPVFTGPAGDAAITSASLGNSTLTGLNSSDISTSSNSVSVNFEGLNFNTSTSVTVDVDFGQTPVTLDPGPSIHVRPTTSLDAGSSEVLAYVTPGETGDTLSVLGGSSAGGTVSLQLIGGQESVVYTAPTSIPGGSGQATINYIVSDQHNDATAVGSATVQLVTPPPTVTLSSSGTIEQGQTIVLATVTPGRTGDTLSFGQTSGTDGGTLSLRPTGLGTVQGTEQVIYTAPGSITSDTTANISYTINESNGGTVSNVSGTVVLDAGPSLTTPVLSSLEPGQSETIAVFSGGELTDTPT